MVPADPRRSYVLIAEDHPLVVESVAACIRWCVDDIEVRVAESLGAALAILRRQPEPALIVSDLTLTDAAGTEAVRAMREAAPGSPLLVVTALDDPTLRNEADRLGVAGYVVKSASTTILRDRIAEILGNVPAGKSAATRQPDPAVSFTRKQQQVLNELVAGRSNREIAARMNIGLQTVASHMKEILARLGVRNRTEAVVRYLQITGKRDGRNR